MTARIGLACVLAILLAGCSSAMAETDNTVSSEEAIAAPSQAAPAPPLASSPLEPPPPPLGFMYEGDLTQGGWIKGKAPDTTISARLGDQELILDEKGNFFAAFDRDAGPTAQLTAQLQHGYTKQSDLTISPRAWNIQRVNIAKRSGGSSEAWWKKREPEWLAIKAAREKVTGAEGWKQEFIWPVKGRISGHFGRQRIYRGEPGSYHSGIDIAPGYGVPFVAPADGVVVLARSGFSLEGNLLIIDHGAGLNSAFLHASRLAVSEGQSVKQGQHIGNVGSTGRSTGPHLHWGLKWNDSRIDPYLLVGPQ